MRKLTVTVIAVVLLAVAGGAVFLAMWDIPAPSSVVERTIPDARFPR